MITVLLFSVRLLEAYERESNTLLAMSGVDVLDGRADNSALNFSGKLNLLDLTL